MSVPKDDAQRLDQELVEAAARVGGALYVYPRPGVSVRQIVLRDYRDERGTQYEEAVVEADGTLRITGVDQGSHVSDFFGPGITMYDWVYVIAPDRIASLVTALGGAADEDVLTVLSAYHQRVSGKIDTVLRGPEVCAQFSNWHSG